MKEQKNIKIVQVSITIPLFNIPIEFYIVNNEKKFIPIITTQIQKMYNYTLTNQECDGFFLQLTDTKNYTHFIIALPASKDGKINLSTLVHEICHCGIALKKYVGIKTRDQFDECLSYIMGAIIAQFCKVSQINDFIKIKIPTVKQIQQIKQEIINE